MKDTVDILTTAQARATYPGASQLCDFRSTTATTTKLNGLTVGICRLHINPAWPQNQVSIWTQSGSNATSTTFTLKLQMQIRIYLRGQVVEQKICYDSDGYGNGFSFIPGNLTGQTIVTSIAGYWTQAVIPLRGNFRVAPCPGLTVPAVVYSATEIYKGECDYMEIDHKIESSNISSNLQIISLAVLSKF